MGAARRAFRFTLVAAWLAACGGAVGQTTSGGESHFLRHCVDECGQGLKCVAGVCTRGCEVDTDECADLGKNARCTDQSVEPGQIAACDVRCSEPADCTVLAADYECEAGFCRGPALPGQDRPDGSGGSGGNGSAPTGDAGAPTAPTGCESAADCPTDYECVLDLARNRGVCVDASRNADCSNGVACPEGYACGAGQHGPTCFPVSVNCWSPWVCDLAEPPPCPSGFARSRLMVEDGVASCLDACVEMTACGCDGAAQCPEGSVCDVEAEQCASWTQPALCALPFEVGPCKADQPVFTYENGACIAATYGGCDGNANRFATQADCLRTCTGSPIAEGCAEGEEPQSVCLECGPVGCGKQRTMCPLSCDNPDDCTGLSDVCTGGQCRVVCF